MRFFNILAQQVAVKLPGDNKLGPMVFDFQQDAADAMVQRLIVTPPEGGPQLTVLFTKAGVMTGYSWEKEAAAEKEGRPAEKEGRPAEKEGAADNRDPTQAPRNASEAALNEAQASAKPPRGVA